MQLSGALPATVSITSSVTCAATNAASTPLQYLLVSFVPYATNMPYFLKPKLHKTALYASFVLETAACVSVSCVSAQFVCESSIIVREQLDHVEMFQRIYCFSIAGVFDCNCSH